MGDAAGVTVESFGAIFGVVELGPHDPYGGGGGGVFEISGRRFMEDFLKGWLVLRAIGRNQNPYNFVRKFFL